MVVPYSACGDLLDEFYLPCYSKLLFIVLQ